MTQRIIKFRAWDKERGIMVSKGNGIVILSTNGVSIDSEDYAVMQYTGLKDKNGKEIYEGDVVKDYKDNIYTVKWMEMGFEGYYGITGFGIEKYDTSFSQSDSSKYEIIGNIYENPELLK